LRKEYRLPEELRPLLARPLGRLYPTSEIAKGTLTEALDPSKLVVTVGDRVTETIAAMGRVPDVQIVDCKENRIARDPPRVEHAVLIRVNNPAGGITQEALDGIKKAFRGKKPARVLVEGEEDLLAIPALVWAPAGASVIYGQPKEGIVVVRATTAAKRRNWKILSSMGVPRF
jgi:GTP-dependent dephospho-CoA kinase